MAAMNSSRAAEASHQPREPRGPIETLFSKGSFRLLNLVATSRANRAALLKLPEAEDIGRFLQIATSRANRAALLKPRSHEGSEPTYERHQPREPRGPIETRQCPQPLPPGTLEATSRANRAALLKRIAEIHDGVDQGCHQPREPRGPIETPNTEETLVP